MTPFALMFTLAAIGISETSYLIRKRKSGEQPVCPIGGGCKSVLQSKYNHMFGVHNDVAGFAFYMLMAVLTALFVLEIEPLIWWRNLAYAAVGFSCLMSLALIYIQWKILKAWCFWCLMSAFTVFSMATILIFDFSIV